MNQAPYGYMYQSVGLNATELINLQHIERAEYDVDENDRTVVVVTLSSGARILTRFIDLNSFREFVSEATSLAEPVDWGY